MVSLALEHSDKPPAFVNINDLVPNVPITLEITDNSLLLVQSSIDDPMIGGQSYDDVSENDLKNLLNEDLDRQELSVQNHEQSSEEKDVEDNRENDPDYEEEHDLVSEDELENLQNEGNLNGQPFMKENSEHENTPENDQTLDVQNQNITNKKRRKKAAPEMWDKNQNKKKRMKGEEYIGYTRSKDGVVEHNTIRGKRVMGSKCDSDFCKKASNRFCHLFTEEIRQSIFDKFWDMNWDQKRLFIANMVTYMKKSGLT